MKLSTLIYHLQHLQNNLGGDVDVVYVDANKATQMYVSTISISGEKLRQEDHIESCVIRVEEVR